MTTTEKGVCPDCGGEMVEGFTLQPAPGGYVISRWIKGHPHKSWWRGVQTKDAECRAIETYRCQQCGLLKSYATTEMDVKDVLPDEDEIKEP
jgi:hypothetical protein